MLVSKIEQKLIAEGINAKVIPSDFNQIIQYLSTLPKKSISQRHIFILTRAENLDDDFAVKNSDLARSNLQFRYREYLEEIEAKSRDIEGHFYLSNLFELGESLLFEVYGNQQNETKRNLTSLVLQDILDSSKKLTMFDVQSVVNLLGLEASWNKNQDLLFRQPLSIELSTRLASIMVARVKHSEFTGIKVIATDADDTLWGGVIGEDSLAEIEIGHDYPGSVFYRYQRFLLDKKNDGILLALVTKNNASDLYSFFGSRKEMPLKIEDFVVIEANWGKKSDALERIANEINVSLDSILFIDDSNFEILEVTKSLPEVSILLLDPKLENRITQIASLELKWATGSTIEDATRTEMIQQNIRRNEQVGNQGEKNLVETLELRLEILTVSDKFDPRFPRVLQLINKTNQFNMTCKRFTEAELEEFMEGGSIYAGVLSDKYGDYGLIAVALVEFPAQDVALFSNFLMSCRALGRTVESVFISEIIANLAGCGFSKVIASWKENPKNMQTQDFYSILGFTLEEESNLKTEREYHLDLNEFRMQTKDIFVEFSAR
jgi:FkbH-like protein